MGFEVLHGAQDRMHAPPRSSVMAYCDTHVPELREWCASWWRAS
jgi:hypothetical protein